MNRAPSVVATERQPAIDEHERQMADWSVLLWSQRQNCLHVERVRHMLGSNRGAYANNRLVDYVPIFIGTNDGCLDLADKLRGTLWKRDQVRLGRSGE